MPPFFFLARAQVLEATEEGDYSVAVPTLSKAFAIIDKNVKRGILHKNTAARKKSQLHLKVRAKLPASRMDVVQGHAWPRNARAGHFESADAPLRTAPLAPPLKLIRSI